MVHTRLHIICGNCATKHALSDNATEQKDRQGVITLLKTTAAIAGIGLGVVFYSLNIKLAQRVERLETHCACVHIYTSKEEDMNERHNRAAGSDKAGHESVEPSTGNRAEDTEALHK